VVSAPSEEHERADRLEDAVDHEKARVELSEVHAAAAHEGRCAR
jgi:hypothetical protein